MNNSSEFEFDQKLNRLADAMLGFQAQIGVMADVIRTHVTQSNERISRSEDQQHRTDERIDRAFEGIERLEMLLENLIRHQNPGNQGS